MKKLTKVTNIYADKKVRLATGLLAGVLVLAWGWCVTTRPAVGVIDFGVAQGKAKLYQSVIAEQRKYEEQIRVRIAADSVDLEKEAQELEKSLQKIELKGNDLEDLMHQFTKKLSVSDPGNETGSFDVRAQ